MIENFNEELNKFLQLNFNYKSCHARKGISDTVNAKTKKFDLYFRYKPNNKDILVIAKINFFEKRKGNGTRLLKFLSEIAINHNIKHIYIESVNKNSFEFGKKFGFEDDGNNNMAISTEDLTKNINSLETLLRKKSKNQI
jgi:hypothetical protein